MYKRIILFVVLISTFLFCHANAISIQELKSEPHYKKIYRYKEIENGVPTTITWYIKPSKVSKWHYGGYKYSVFTFVYSVHESKKEKYILTTSYVASYDSRKSLANLKRLTKGEKALVLADSDEFNPTSGILLLEHTMSQYSFAGHLESFPFGDYYPFSDNRWEVEREPINNKYYKLSDLLFYEAYHEHFDDFIQP